MLQQVGNAFARTISLERRAYGLDEDSGEKPYEERLREWLGQRAAANAPREDADG